MPAYNNVISFPLHRVQTKASSPVAPQTIPDDDVALLCVSFLLLIVASGVLVSWGLQQLQKGKPHAAKR